MGQHRKASGDVSNMRLHDRRVSAMWVRFCCVSAMRSNVRRVSERVHDHRVSFKRAHVRRLSRHLRLVVKSSR